MNCLTFFDNEIKTYTKQFLMNQLKQLEECLLTLLLKKSIMSENIFSPHGECFYVLCEKLINVHRLLGTIKKSVSPVCYTPEPINNMTHFCRLR